MGPPRACAGDVWREGGRGMFLSSKQERGCRKTSTLQKEFIRPKKVIHVKIPFHLLFCRNVLFLKGVADVSTELCLDSVKLFYNCRAVLVCIYCANFIWVVKQHVCFSSFKNCHFQLFTAIRYIH